MADGIEHEDDGNQTSPPDKDYPLSPRDSRVIERDTDALSDEAPEEVDPWAPRPEEYQFSLAELMLLVTAAAVVLGILRLFPPKWSAMAAGLGALVCLIALAVRNPSWAILYVGWWVLFLIYVLTCAAALLQG